MNDHDIPPRATGPRVEIAYQRIEALPGERQGEARRRFSRSFSASPISLRAEGCTFEGLDVVWPDGERWPRAYDRPIPHDMKEPLPGPIWVTDRIPMVKR